MCVCVSPPPPLYNPVSIITMAIMEKGREGEGGKGRGRGRGRERERESKRWGRDRSRENAKRDGGGRECVCVCFTFLFLSDLIKYITTSCTYTIELCLLSPSVQYDVSLSLCVVAVHQTHTGLPSAPLHFFIMFSLYFKDYICSTCTYL